MEDITFASLLTAAGAGIAAALVTTTVELVKRVWTGMPVAGATLAFILSAVVYLLAGIATNASTLDSALGVFIAWLTCATAAVGVHSTITYATKEKDS